MQVGGESSTILQRDIAKGEVLKFNDTYFQALKSIKTGSEINGIDTGNFEIGQIVDGDLLYLGSVPPKMVEDLSYMIQTLTTGGEDRWFLGKSYQQGDLVKFEDKYFEATEDVLIGLISECNQSITRCRNRFLERNMFIDGLTKR